MDTCTVKKYSYVVSKQFDVFLAESAQSFRKFEYMVDHGELAICPENLKPATTDVIVRDLILCYYSLMIINIDIQSFKQLFDTL